jgi:hypothetical protein
MADKAILCRYVPHGNLDLKIHGGVTVATRQHFLLALAHLLECIAHGRVHIPFRSVGVAASDGHTGLVNTPYRHFRQLLGFTLGTHAL